METVISAQDFLIDLVPLVKEWIEKCKEKKPDEYELGKIFAYYNLLSLIKDQALSFDLSIEQLGLDYELLDELLIKHRN